MEQSELIKKLKFVRDIRINYIDQYNINKEEISFDYSLLPNLDNAEFVNYDKNGKIIWGKIVHTKNITNYNPYLAIKYNTGEQQAYWGDNEIIHGNFIEELGYIYYKKLIDEKFTENFIHLEEKKIFNDLINFTIYSLNQEIKYVKENIKKEMDKNIKLEERLKYFNGILK